MYPLNIAKTSMMNITASIYICHQLTDGIYILNTYMYIQEERFKLKFDCKRFSTSKFDTQQIFQVNFLNSNNILQI